MKVTIDTSLDMIIYYEPRPINRNEKGTIIWVNEKEKTTVLKNEVRSISIYPFRNEKGREILPIILHKNDINKIYQKISEIEKDEYIGFFEDDDLPF